MNKDRYIYREICHAIEHLELGNIGAALMLLIQARRNEEERNRKEDNDATRAGNSDIK